MTDLTLQTLLDRAAISDVFNRYALGVDTRDWALVRTITWATGNGAVWHLAAERIKNATT